MFGVILTSMGFLIYMLKTKKKVKLNEEAIKVQPSSCVVYEEICSAVSI